MKTIKKSSRKKPFIITLLVAVVLLGGGAAAYVVQQNNRQTTTDQQVQNEDTVDYEPPTQEQITDGQNTKQNNLPAKESPQPNPQTPNETPTKKDVSIEISSVNQTDTMLKVRVAIETIDANSTCKITLTKGATTGYSASVATQTMPSYSLCKGFDIPLKELTKGEWNCNIIFESKNFKGNVSQIVTIE